jgi:hypothetical protein
MSNEKRRKIEITVKGKVKEKKIGETLYRRLTGMERFSKFERDQFVVTEFPPKLLHIDWNDTKNLQLEHEYLSSAKAEKTFPFFDDDLPTTRVRNRGDIYEVTVSIKNSSNPTFKLPLYKFMKKISSYRYKISKRHGVESGIPVYYVSEPEDNRISLLFRYENLSKPFKEMTLAAIRETFIKLSKPIICFRKEFAVVEPQMIRQFASPIGAGIINRLIAAPYLEKVDLSPRLNQFKLFKHMFRDPGYHKFIPMASVTDTMLITQTYDELSKIPSANIFAKGSRKSARRVFIQNFGVWLSTIGVVDVDKSDPNNYRYTLTEHGKRLHASIDEIDALPDNKAITIYNVPEVIE